MTQANKPESESAASASAKISAIESNLAQPSVWKARLGRGLVFIMVVGLALFLAAWYVASPIICTYAARIAATGVFLQKRELTDIQKHDLAILPIVSVTVDKEAKTARASLGPYSRTAVYRNGVGACVAVNKSISELEKLTLPHPAPANFEQAAWPVGNKARIAPESLGVDAEKLNAALDWAFAEPNPKLLKRTRAVVVLYKGQIIAERYADGFDKSTPILGWSMTKSVLAILYGRATKLGKVDIHEPAPVSEWQAPNDPRKAITIDQLLRMSDGLDFQEHYFSPFSDVLQMLFVCDSVSDYAASRPLKAKPDSRWYYSSGSSNLLSRILMQKVGGKPIDALKFAQTELFQKLSMHSAQIEADESGTMIASSYMYATARDWARFGQFCLQNGNWNGQQLLPDDWMAYAVKPTPKAPRGRYGAHFWLNHGTGKDGKDRYFPTVPRDGYYASGFQGQCCFVIPSRDCVVVRLGVTNSRKAWSHGKLVERVLKSLPE